MQEGVCNCVGGGHTAWTYNTGALHGQLVEFQWLYCLMAGARVLRSCDALVLDLLQGFFQDQKEILVYTTIVHNLSPELEPKFLLCIQN